MTTPTPPARPDRAARPSSVDVLQAARQERLAKNAAIRTDQKDRKRLRDKAEIAWLAAGNTRPLMEMSRAIIDAEIEKERAKEKGK